MLSRGKNILPWLIGVLVATLLFAALYAYTDFHYYGSGDTPILRSFMGYEGGVPATYHLYLHTVFAWLLHGLALLAPGVAWFSILQLFLLWLSAVVIVKSMAQCAQHHRFSPWLGGLFGALYLFAYAALITCRISYTTTGALLGAAAVAQLMGIDYQNASPRQILWGMCLSIALLLCCYGLRQIGVLPSLAFWLLALALIWLTNYSPIRKDTAPSKARRNARPLFIGMLICALSFGVLAGIRAVEIKTLKLDDYLRWQEARINLFDYTDYDSNVDPALLEEVGWSPAEFKLISSWYFMDRNITTEAFEKFYAAQPTGDASLSAKLASATATVRSFFADNPIYFYACGISAILCLVCMLWPLLGRKPRGAVLALAAVFGLLLGAAMLGYLGFQGRLPMRAAVSAIFPMSTFLFCLLFSCAERSETPKTHSSIPIGITSALCLTLTVCSCLQTAQIINPQVDPEVEARSETPADLDAFALENPDVLIIYDLSLIGDNRLFPDTSAGIPPNLMFWGGYPARSPSWLYQLSQYGIDGTAMTARDFLRENVVVASTDGEPWESLMTYVGESSEGTVDWDFYSEYGYIGFFQLYEE